MADKSSIGATGASQNNPSSNHDELFNKKLSELNAKLSELNARFSGEKVVEKKCPFCATERSREAAVCRFCKRVLTVENATKENVAKANATKATVIKENATKTTVTKASATKENITKVNVTKANVIKENVKKKQEADEPQEKIIYIIRGNRRNTMEWHKIANTDEERKAVEKKYGRGLTIEEVTAKLTRKGWAVSHKDEKTITFSRYEKPFNIFMFLFLLCLFVFPALIYAIGTRSSKTVNVTFPLK